MKGLSTSSFRVVLLTSWVVLRSSPFVGLCCSHFLFLSEWSFTSPSWVVPLFPSCFWVALQFPLSFFGWRCFFPFVSVARAQEHPARTRGEAEGNGDARRDRPQVHLTLRNTAELRELCESPEIHLKGNETKHQLTSKIKELRAQREPKREETMDTSVTEEKPWSGFARTTNSIANGQWS